MSAKLLNLINTFYKYVNTDSKLLAEVKKNTLNMLVCQRLKEDAELGVYWVMWIIKINRCQRQMLDKHQHHIHKPKEAFHFNFLCVTFFFC